MQRKRDLSEKFLRFFHFRKEEEESEEPEEHEAPVEPEKSKSSSPKYRYLKMKLPVERITPEFEKKIEKEIHSQVKIRECKTEEDLEVVLHLYNRSFMAASDPFSPLNLDQIKQIANYGNTRIFIASLWGEDTGFVIIDFEYKKDEDLRIGVICGLGTLPRWQRRGIGTTLGIYTWQHFKPANVDELRCEVFDKNEGSISLIKGLGFEQYGEVVYEY